MDFYLQHMTLYPELCLVAEHVHVIAKYDLDLDVSTGSNKKCHICAVTVLDIARGHKVATYLVKRIESQSIINHCNCISLFVRCSNEPAVSLYKKLSYKVHKVLKNYYSEPDPEDAFDMRKCCNGSSLNASGTTIVKRSPSAASKEKTTSTLGLRSSKTGPD